MEFGKTLREAREAKGYTIAQLADMTHIMARAIEGLEAEDFRSIPAPIYGRGFVKMCCQCLGLDQKTMVDEFMAIYNGEKPAAKPAPIPTETISVKQSVPPVTPSPAPIASVKPVVTPEAPAAKPMPPPAQNFGELFNQPAESAPAPKNAPSRFAPPQPQDGGKRLDLNLPAIPWRLVMLIVGALILLWIAIAGCRAIYRALSKPAEPPAVVESTPAPKAAPKTAPKTTANAKAPAPAAKSAARQPKAVKPLYID